MGFRNRWFSILLAVCVSSTAFAQDSLRVSGVLDDTLALQQSVVTAKSREQKLREGAYAVNALNIRVQASTLNSLSSAIDRTAGIRIREEGGVGSDYDLSINGMSGNSIRYFLDGMPLDAKGTGITLANLPVGIIERVEIYKGVIPASFGSDAPHLTGFKDKIICGPGTIQTAHRPDEHLLLEDFNKAIDIYVNIYESYN